VAIRDHVRARLRRAPARSGAGQRRWSTSTPRRPGFLETLPGIDGATAARIADIRGRIGGFSSPADRGMTAGLEPAGVDDLRGRVVFL
jgi:hypothetical protein